MNKNYHLLYALIFALVLLPVVSCAETWVPPQDNPPNGNASAPINVSADDQGKAGKLFVGGLFQAVTGLLAGPLTQGETALPGNLLMRVKGKLGATEYCDALGNNCTPAGQLGGGFWAKKTGTENIYNTNTGYVGIGTNDPKRPLHFASALSTFIIEKTDAAADEKKRYIGSGGGAMIFGKFVDDASSSAEHMRIDKNGYVGIGTAAPEGKLSIRLSNTSTDPNTSTYPLRLENNAWASNMISGIEFWNGANHKTFPTSRIISQMQGGGGGGERLLFQTQPSSATNPNPNKPTTKMVIENDGNVGIGVDSPDQKLTIGGSGQALGVDNGSYFAAKNTGGAYENFLWPRWTDNISYLNYGSSGFHIRNNTSGSTMFMTNANNVGIGDTSPDSGTGGQLKLDVAGNVGATKYCDASGNNCYTTTEMASGGGATAGVTKISAAPGSLITVSPSTGTGDVVIGTGNVPTYSLNCITPSPVQWYNNTGADAYRGIDVTCPAGYLMTGGGSDGFKYGPDSTPSYDTGWHAEGTVQPGSTISIYVRCCRVQ